MASLLLAVPAAAQVQVVEQEQLAEGEVVQPPPVAPETQYVGGVGRGVQYGAHFVSPYYLTNVRREDGTQLRNGAGFGILGRLGFEFPAGFTLEVLGGVAGNGVDTDGVATSNVMLRVDLGLGARYMIFNESAFVPFIQLAGVGRWFWIEWQDTMRDDGTPTFALQGAVGAQIELSPWFGIEAGLAVEYTFWGELFAEGLVSLMPFLGVTIYVYDETGN